QQRGKLFVIEGSKLWPASMMNQACYYFDMMLVQSLQLICGPPPIYYRIRFRLVPLPNYWISYFGNSQSGYKIDILVTYIMALFIQLVTKRIVYPTIRTFYTTPDLRRIIFPVVAH